MATSLDNRIEYLLLQLLENQIVPLGAGATRDALAQRGIEVGEATAGRMLRELERTGLAEKVGVQGRILTEKGRRRLQELSLEKEQARSAEEFVRALRSTSSKEIEDVLVARRAIEAETARLAAENATDREIEILGEIVRDMMEQVRTGEPIASSDERFHFHLARISGNHVLEAALKLIRHNGRYSPILEAIRNQAGTLTGKGHQEIFNAIKARDAEAASKAMTAHINAVLEDVHKFRSEHEEENS